MERLGEILAKNVKEYRRKCGLTQEKLAEMVDVSTHHIGMIELARNFPRLDLVERIAKALDIEIYRLFMEPHSPNVELEQLRQEINSDMKQLLDDAIQKALYMYCYQQGEPQGALRGAEPPAEGGSGRRA